MSGRAPRSAPYDLSVDVFSRTAAKRRLLADFFDTLSPDQLATRSLCDRWTVREDEHGTAPGVGPMGQMTDGCMHLRDCARPLELPDDGTLEDWRMVLTWLPSGVPGLVPRRRFDGLSLKATDQDWAWGSGEEVTGASEALAMAMTGRVGAVADLRGDGVETLPARVRQLALRGRREAPEGGLDDGDASAGEVSRHRLRPTNRSR